MRNDWEEKMFEIKRMDLDWNGEILERIAAARIGEHAIARFFQRNKNIYNEKTEDYDLFKIIPEFIYVAYLADLWGMFFIYIGEAGKYSTQGLSIPFVTMNGIFIGDTTGQDYSCDIRTYISNEKLTDGQRVCAVRIRELIHKNEFEKIAFLNHTIERSPIQEGITLDMKFFAQLWDVHSELIEIITWQIKDKDAKQFWKEKISMLLKSFQVAVQDGELSG
jgi:hypothetical protein